MGKVTGFTEFGRIPPTKRPVVERIHDFKELYLEWADVNARDQGARCMACSIPFCHKGCPLGNLIPDWNDLVYRDKWENALATLHSTNNFPEFTGRICPAPCEASCVLSINQDPVTIESIEKAIADRGWREGWIVPEPPERRTGKTVAVVGSGPAGLAAAQQLNRCGHTVTVIERDEFIGGLLRLGIPDFKLEKHLVEARVDQMREEGVLFKTGIYVGVDIPASMLVEQFDVLCITGGATHARDMSVPGRDLRGIHLAMEYLTQQNRINSGLSVDSADRITAAGKRVVILGGGDTGADCLGTAHRQGAEEVHQFELLPEPPKERHPDNPWPQWPLVLSSSPAHEEGGIRDYNILTERFSGSNGNVEQLHAVRIERGPPADSGLPDMKEVPNSAFEIKTDLVLLAMGFLHPEHDGMVTQLGLDLDSRGNVATDENKMTNIPSVFAAGDMARGQSLVVWALAEGRDVAATIDKHLMGNTSLSRVLDAG